MHDLTTFDYDSQAVRTVMIDGAPWFVAVDVCRILDLANPRQVIDRLDEDEVRVVNLNTVHSNDGIQAGVHNADTLRGNPNMNVVSESGLYALIFTSRKEEAKAFRKWVTGTVLPSLRRDGVFVMDHAPHPDTLSSSPAFGLDMATREAENWTSLLRELRFVAGPKVVRGVWAKSPFGALLQEQGFDPVAKNTASFEEAADFITASFDVTGHSHDVIPAAQVLAMYAAWRGAGDMGVGAENALAKHLAALSRVYRHPDTGKRFSRRKSSIWYYDGLRLKGDLA